MPTLKQTWVLRQTLWLLVLAISILFIVSKVSGAPPAAPAAPAPMKQGVVPYSQSRTVHINHEGKLFEITLFDWRDGFPRSVVITSQDRQEVYPRQMR